MSEIQHTGDQSPFDAIKRVTPEGREYWSARELIRKRLGLPTIDPLPIGGMV